MRATIRVLIALLLAKHESEAFSTSAHPLLRDASTIHPLTCKSVRIQVSSITPFQSTTMFAAPTGKQHDTLDVDALVKYVTAGLVQMAGFAVVLLAFDEGAKAMGFEPPFWLNFLIFYACSLKSRAFNPLSNERPKVGSPLGAEIVRPSWFPPGVIFPIMWILIIGPIRAYSSALVYDTAGHYVNIATLSFLLHLTMGDIWNTINNVEKRLGAASSGVVFVILSAANASYQYYNVNTSAGELLSVTLLWLCTAGALVASIWQLNQDPITGKKDALFPARGALETQFSWFNKIE